MVCLHFFRRSQGIRGDLKGQYYGSIRKCAQSWGDTSDGTSIIAKLIFGRVLVSLKDVPIHSYSRKAADTGTQRVE